MKNKIGKICIVLGTMLILAAFSLFLWNQREAQKAKESVEEILPQVMENIQENISNLYNPEMTEVEIDGYNYIGYVSIPELGLDLPVMSTWDDTRMTIAPCRYSGSTKTNDLVILAHNHPFHFGTLYKLSPGDEVIFTDMDGVVSTYQVVSVDTLSPTAVEEMKSGEYDLTLFTCNFSATARVTVRCNRVE